VRPAYVVPFRALGLDDVALVGGKSAHLGDLTQAGFPVPPGFAVTSRAFDAVVGARVDDVLAGVDQEDVAALEARAAEARDLVGSLPVPDEVADAIRDGYGRLAGELGVERPPVAARSSAVAEDAADASFAGLQSTYLSLRGPEEALTGVRRCWASYCNAEALAYRARHGGAAGMSVAVQAMVDARVAGVMFTLNPVTGDPSSVAIDASWGLGVTVVGGEVTPDSYLWSKVARQVVRTRLGTKEIECAVDPDGGGVVTRPVPDELRARPCLEPAEVERLAELGRAVEGHYGRPQDVEWAIERGSGELLLLQARPETVWTPKRAGAEAGSAAERVAAMYLRGGWIRT
jgi:pyruvate, water dikinase